MRVEGVPSKAPLATRLATGIPAMTTDKAGTFSLSRSSVLRQPVMQESSTAPFRLASSLTYITLKTYGAYRP